MRLTIAVFCLLPFAFLGRKWWNNAYGWGFSPVNLVTGRREDRNRIPRATVGFANALLVTGDQKYGDAWRAMIEAVNSHTRTVDGRKEYPTMYGDDGWYGWRAAPWNVGALELWYWSMKPEDRPRIGRHAWVEYLEGRNPGFPETVVVQGGGYGEHQILSAEVNGRSTPVNARDFTVNLAPGAGAKLTLAMKRYANTPTAKFPWDR